MQENEIKNMAQKSYSGSEGTVYLIHDYAYKIFKEDKSKDFLKKKEKKIDELSKINLEGFIKPINKIYNKKSEFIGYKMENVNAKTDVYEICHKYREHYTLDKKIEYLLKVEKLIKAAHKKGVILNDCAIWNFLVLSNDEVLGIDVDNFELNNLDSETTPTFYLQYYKTLTNENNTSVNSDKLSFALYALRSLMKYPFENEAMKKYNKRINENILMTFNYLDIPEDAKNEIKDILSDNKEKEWIGKTLTKFSSNSRKFLL